MTERKLSRISTRRIRLDGAMNKHLCDCALIAYGYGDGGGGPDEDMVRTALYTEDTFRDARVEHTTVSAFMKKLSSRKLPVYAGELYLELHRGTLTMHHDIKRNNRKLEISLHDAEFLSAVSDGGPTVAETQKWWDVLLLNQFHDILPGTCIAKVNDIARAEVSKALAECEAYVRQEGRPYVNTLSFNREETLETENGEQTYTDFDEKKHALGRYSFAAFAEGKRITGNTKSPFSYKNGVLKTPFGKVKIQNGRIASYICGGREIADGLLNDLRICEDVPRLWDNWDIDADLPMIERKVPCVSQEVVSDGPHHFRIRCRYRFGKASDMVTDIVFDAYSPLVTFENKLNWQEDHALLRAYFETDIFSPTVKNEIQFGWLERPTTRNTGEEQAKFEVCNHKWSDLSETNFGMALLNDCKYGCGCKDKTLHLTLCKGGTHPDERGDHGIKYFSYGILPHKGGFGAKAVVQPAYRFNYAPARRSGCRSPIVSIDRDGIIAETMLQTVNGILVRLYECERSAASCEIRLAEDFRVSECDMMENIIKEHGKKRIVKLSFRPFEIKTLLLQKK